jgi:glycosyltransferase involved in cell wall biosynthesis
MGINYLKMRIGFDMRPFLREETGVGIYFKNLLFSLAEIDRTNEYFLFSSSWKDRFQAEKIPAFSRMKFLDVRFPVKVINFAWYKLGWPAMDIFFKTGLDLTHSPTPLPLPTRGKKIVTVYDLFFWEHPRLTDKDARRNFLRRFEDSVRNADGVVTISRFTEDQLIQRGLVDRKRIRVLSPGIDLENWERINSHDLERIKTNFDLPPDFLLFVGAFEPRKNLPALLKALRIVHDRYLKIPLVLVGRKGRDSENVRSGIRKLDLDSWVKILGYMDASELKNVYRLASVFVFPSLWEGFGIPLLEAMACRLPIVTSGKSALPEIAQDAAVYADPDDPEEIAAKIIDVLRDRTLREKLVAAGQERVRFFRWETAASGALEFYQAVMRE